MEEDEVRSEIVRFWKSLIQIGRRGKISSESGGKSTRIMRLFIGIRLETVIFNFYLRFVEIQRGRV